MSYVAHCVTMTRVARIAFEIAISSATDKSTDPVQQAENERCQRNGWDVAVSALMEAEEL